MPWPEFEINQKLDRITQITELFISRMTTFWQIYQAYCQLNAHVHTVVSLDILGLYVDD